MGSFEETYDDDELRSFKPTQLKKLQELHVQLDSKFNEIVELLARELGHAKNNPRVHDEAESAIQRWAEDAQMAEHPMTKGELQRFEGTSSNRRGNHGRSRLANGHQARRISALSSSFCTQFAR